jgi:hypothetical protein
LPFFRTGLQQDSFTMASLPPFKHTIEFAIPDISAKIRKSYLSHKTRPLEWRLTQLRKLYWGCDLSSSLYADAWAKLVTQVEGQSGSDSRSLQTRSWKT